MHFSSLATDNLREYMSYAISMSGGTVRTIGNLILTINSRPDSLFNYVFPTDGTYEECEQSAKNALDYLEKEKIDTTWVVDSHTKGFGRAVDKLGFAAPNVVKKAFMKIPMHAYIKNHGLSLVLEAVSTDSALTELDCMASKIFYCNVNDLAILLKGMVKHQPPDLRFFLAKLHGATVGLCGMYVRNQVVGLYSDGVLPEYRNMGIASDMVLQRLEMARELYKCRYAVAQCVERSVGMYSRLGFRMTGNLSLYASLMA